MTIRDFILKFISEPGVDLDQEIKVISSWGNLCSVTATQIYQDGPSNQFTKKQYSEYGDENKKFGILLEA